MLYLGDCLKILQELKNETVDMIYLDPPFFSQKTQRLTNHIGETHSFDDKWSCKSEYLDYMKERIVELKRVLKNDGTIFLHCDTSASWYLKIILDEVFGEKNFRSEIIWSYKRWSNSQKNLTPNHQTIFFYSKSAEYKFNTIYGEYSATTNVDQILQERSRNGLDKSSYKRDSDGNIVLCKAKKGVPLSDVWEIPFLNPKAKERVGYPTQKPIELLDRIIQIGTNEGDIVLDPFCGSGTTLVSAKLLKRKYIGIDVNAEAIRISKERLEKPFKTESILLKKGIDSYKTKSDKEIAILNQFDCDIVQRNKGIDAFLRDYYDGAPVAIKIQKETETFSEAVNLLDSAAKKKKCKACVLIFSNKDSTIIPSNMVLLKRDDVKLHESLLELKSKQI